MDDTRVVDFFKESKRIPFDSLPTALITGRATLETGTNINARAVFENVPIYEIPNWVRGKNKHVKIPYPGLPYVVLSAKSGREVRGIVKDLNILTKQKGNKGKFPNQVALDIALKDKIVNVMIFPNMMKISGSQKPEHLVEAFIFIKSILLMLQNKGIKVFDKSPVLTKLDIDMENVVFDLGFNVRRQVLMEKAIQSGALSPPEDEAVRVLYPMGRNRTKGGPRYYNFRIIHTGKVVYSGDNRKNMKAHYEKFMDFITANEDEIRFY